MPDLNQIANAALDAMKSAAGAGKPADEQGGESTGEAVLEGVADAAEVLEDIL